MLRPFRQACVSDPAAAPTDPTEADGSAGRPSDTAFLVDLDGFAGPIERLLELVRQQRVDLGRISLLTLVEQFAAALDRARGRVPLERQGEWLLVATWLVLLKSRLLLPAGSAEAEQAANAVQAELLALEDRAAMRAAAAWLQARPQLGEDWFVRGRRPSAAPRRSGFVALLEAGLVVFRGADGRPEEAVYRPPLPRLWLAIDAIARIRALLAASPEGGSLSLFLPSLAAAADRPLRARAAVASTLMAALELARTGEAGLEQPEDFAAITLRAIAAVHAPLSDPARPLGRAGGPEAA
jgi:segregation and condensation protein A